MISVIISVYNVEKYLHVCINSILKQSYQDFEIICIDDASTDSSTKILEYFAEKDSRIKIIKNKLNMGPGQSRNKGIEVAKGKYILFLDSDDWYSPNALELLFNEAEKNNLDIVIAKAIVYYDDKKRFDIERMYNIISMENFYGKVFNYKDIDASQLLRIPVAVWSKLYLKSFLNENNIRFPKENLIQEDNPFSYKGFIKARRMFIINKYIYTRRRREGSIMTMNNGRLFDNIKISFLLLDMFLEDRMIYEKFKKEVLTLIFVILLDNKYNHIEEQYKSRFFSAVQGVYRSFINDYGLYDDIKRNIDGNILNFYEFEKIAKDILG